MWKSRADKLPPTQFFADLIAHLRNLYPGASLDEKLARAMRDIWVAEWRAGQSAQDTAKATCSCDGTTIVPSAGAGRDLGKRLARPPKGSKRGDFVAPDDLREVTPLAAARREAERYAQAFDRVRAVTLKLLQVKGWSAAKALRLQKLRSTLGEIKAKHEAAVAKYESIRQSRREAKQPALYEKPLGAVGLTLRPDELPEPPPEPPRAKEKKPAKEKKLAKDKKASKETQAPTENAAPTPRTLQAAKPSRTLATVGAHATPGKNPADCKCKQEASTALPVVSPSLPDAAPVAPAVSIASASAQVAQPVPTAAEKPKRGRKPKATVAAATPAAAEPAKAALSESEAEELANLFAQASAEDKPS